MDYFNGNPQFPTPWAEGLNPGRGFVTGCVSITQLRHWFGRKWLVDAFERAHLQLAHYRAPADAVLVGKYQAPFQIARATLLEHWPVSNILRPRREWKNATH